MERKYIPQTENKLLILYAIRALQPVTETQLLQFMVELDLMNYFSLQLGLCELQEQNQLSRKSHPFGSVLYLSSRGAEVLNEFLHRVPQSIREAVDSASAAHADHYHLQQQTPADSHILQAGQMCLRLRLLENESTLLDILYTLPAGQTLYRIQERWTAASTAIYSALAGALFADAQLTPSASPLPEGTDVQPCDNGDWLLTLCGTDESEPMVLILSLPQEHLARHCAARWPACREQMKAVIYHELSLALSE